MENIKKYSSIFLGVAYFLGFIAWNYLLRQLGFFEYQLIQTRFLSAGLLILSPFILLFLIWPKLLKSLMSFINNSSVSRFILVVIFLIYCFLFINFFFPLIPQYFGGGRPISAGIVATQDKLQILNDFGATLGDNADKKAIQTKGLCIFYQNSDVLLLGIPKNEYNELSNKISILQGRILIMSKDAIIGFDFLDEEIGCMSFKTIYPFDKELNIRNKLSNLSNFFLSVIDESKSFITRQYR